MSKLIVTDLDGTLIKSSEETLSVEFVNKIIKFTDCGNIFAVNSGRPYGHLKKYLEPLLGRTVFICNDGAQIMYKNCLLHKSTISNKIVLELCKGVDFEKLLPVAYLREKNIIITHEVLRLPAFFGQDILKIVFTKKSPLKEDLLYLKTAAESLGLRVCYEDGDYLEFCLKEANKGFAIEVLKKKFSSLNDIIAFGDSESDFSMFKMADKVFLCQGKKGVTYPGAKIINSAQEYIIKEL